MYLINVYIPESALETVKQAMFNAGAGRIGNYDSCAWQVRGKGQFRPLTGSQPTIGVTDTLETVVEYKLEMVCDENRLADVIAAIRASHPYDEPAYQYWAVNEGG